MLNASTGAKLGYLECLILLQKLNDGWISTLPIVNNISRC